MSRYTKQQQWAQRPVHSVPRPARARTLAEYLVAAPEFRDASLQALVFSSLPGLVNHGLASNPCLDEELWVKAYTFRPKVAIETALALVSRPLSPLMLTHLLEKEHRVGVWEQVMRYTLLERSVVQQLGRKNLVSVNARLSGVRWLPLGPEVSVFQCTTQWASTAPIHVLVESDGPQRGAVVNWLLERLGTSPVGWELLLSIVDSFEGTVAECAEMVERLMLPATDSSLEDVGVPTLPVHRVRTALLVAERVGVQ